MKKIIISSFLFVFSLFGFLSTSADVQLEEKVLYVAGVAEYEAEPDSGEIILGVEVDSKQASEAQQKASERVKTLINQLISAGIKKTEIKTVSNSLNPVRDYNVKPYRIISYTAIQKIRISIEESERLNLLSKTIDLVASNPINNIESVNYYASSELVKEVRRKVLELAVQDAMKTGESILSSLGLKISEVLRINLNASNASSPSPYRVDDFAVKMNAMAAAPEQDYTELMPGKMKFTATANLALRYQ